MARPKTEFRNELKTRVTDDVYDSLQRYMQVKRCASEARAISELLELALFGQEALMIPLNLVESSHGTVQFGPKTHA